MASFDSPVYEHGESIGDYTTYPKATTDDQPQHMNSDTNSPTHSDASTVEKKPSVLNGVDGSRAVDDVDDDDDDEHEYTYPDGITGGTFDAPAPTSALITAPKTEEVMMTEVVMPDSRQPDYCKSQPRTTKPYAFYGRFHSVYQIGKIIGLIFLFLVAVAACTVLVLRVSVDHEFFDDEEESTTAPLMTSRFTSSITVTGIDGQLIEFSDALNDMESEEYARVAAAVEDSMDAIYTTGELSDIYQGSEVTDIRYGSVIVDVVLTFKSTSEITSNDVETEIQNELARNSNVIGEIMVDPQSVLVTDYDVKPPITETIPSSKPSVTPVSPTDSIMSSPEPMASFIPDASITSTETISSSITPPYQPMATSLPDTTEARSTSLTDSIVTSQTSKTTSIQETTVTLQPIEPTEAPLPSSTTVSQESQATSLQQNVTISTYTMSSPEPMGSSNPDAPVTSTETIPSSITPPYQPIATSFPDTTEARSTSLPDSIVTSQKYNTTIQDTTVTLQESQATSLQEDVTISTYTMTTSLPSTESSVTSIPDTVITSIESMDTPSTDSPDTTIIPTESTTPYFQTTPEPMGTSPTDIPETSPEESQTTEEAALLTSPQDTGYPGDMGTSPSGIKTSPDVTTSLEINTPTNQDTIPVSLTEYVTEEHNTSYSVYPGSDCSEDEILCANEGCVPVDLLCNGDPSCMENREQLECPVGINYTCSEQLEFLIKYCEYYNETCPWYYSCLDDGSWDPVQCFQLTNECFCVDEYGGDIPGTWTVNGSRPNCTEAASTSPSPVLSRKKRQIFKFAQVPCPQVQCKNGQCVDYFQLSDGIDDCGDYSDEKFLDCGTDPFMCDDYNCIHSDFVCDGEPDCVPNTLDEDNCEELIANVTGLP